jgi:hypothetical protein
MIYLPHPGVSTPKGHQIVGGLRRHSALVTAEVIFENSLPLDDSAAAMDGRKLGVCGAAWAWLSAGNSTIWQST